MDTTTTYAPGASGIGVLDKIVDLLDHLSREPRSLPELVQAVGLPKPTVHRLLQGLNHHGLIERDADGRYALGVRVAEWGLTARSLQILKAKAQTVLDDLRDLTGLSSQLYVRSGTSRLCLATSEPAQGLRDTVPIGAHLTMSAGSAAQVLLAWEAIYASPLEQSPTDAAITTTADRIAGGATAFSRTQLAEVRKKGYAVSVGQRVRGVASVSAPVYEFGRVVAAVSVSGPIDLMGRRPGAKYAAAVRTAGAALSTGGRAAPDSAA